MKEENPHINPNYKLNRLNKTDINRLFEGIKHKEVLSLSKGITLIESTNPEHRQQANELIKMCLPLSGKSWRIGITGTPGAGKSTFIEALGNYYCNKGKKVAVLAIDPSSTVSKGSILGDKTRMEKLSVNPNAFIRPSASSGTLGGVARATSEAILLCEAAGYEIIFVETVGVGQSETEVHSMTDLFVLLTGPAAGDELQGIKRGIMEMADIILVNKNDGELKTAAKNSLNQIKNALHLFPKRKDNWIVQAIAISALLAEGIENVNTIINQFFMHQNAHGLLTQKRQQQEIQRLNKHIEQTLFNRFLTSPKAQKLLKQATKRILTKKSNAYIEAEELINLYLIN